MTNTDLKELLDALHDKYNSPDFIADDPISVPHRYTDRADREIAGFFSATIAWGNRKAIVRSGHRMMHFMDDAPADFVRIMRWPLVTIALRLPHAIVAARNPAISRSARSV